MFANKAWGTGGYRATVACDAAVYNIASVLRLVMITRDARRFEIDGTSDEWRAIHLRLGEELARYQRTCSGCFCSPCQCEERGIRRPLFAARKDYLAALKRAEDAENFASRANGVAGLPEADARMADTNAMLSREAADIAFGVFARMAAAEGMVAELDGAMREKGP